MNHQVEIDGLIYSTDEIKDKCLGQPKDMDYAMDYRTKIEYYGNIYKHLGFFLDSRRYMLFVREDAKGDMVWLANPVDYGATFGELVKSVPENQRHFLRLIRD